MARNCLSLFTNALTNGKTGTSDRLRRGSQSRTVAAETFVNNARSNAG
jgi:hypothetical protein